MGVYDINGNDLLSDIRTDGLEDVLPNRVLIWHDEFDKQTLDESKWTVVYGLRETMWDTKFAYVKDIQKVTSTGDGLSYSAIKDNPYNGIPYSCPHLITKDKFEFRYGRIEAKIKFPENSAHHSTLWTLGACSYNLSSEEGTSLKRAGVNFPSCGEIDMAEFDNNSVGARMHWSPDGFDGTSDEIDTGADNGNIWPLVGTPSAWHIYACEWTETNISFYVDGVLKKTWAISNATVNGWNPFNHPHYLILNCITAISGTVNWDVATTNVKWIRVYAPAGTMKYTKETAVSIPNAVSIVVGERHWLGTPSFTPSNPSDMTIKWKSHNENIVTCFGGMLVGISEGSTFVQCTTKHGYTSLCKVTVTAS